MSNMISPPFLKSGSKIRIVSPAGKVEERYVLPAVDWLKKQGYKVELGKHVFAQHFQFAGTDAQRLEDLQIAFDDSETDVILCSRGGYGTVRIINQLDFTDFKKYPKWLVGFSDVTILHSCLNNLGIATIHGVMPKHFLDKKGNSNENLNSLINLLKGEKTEYSILSNEFNRNGNVSAELVGGNLSIISSMTGTKCDLDTTGKILFLEDIDEFLYHSDRMIHQLKLAGKLDNLTGLVLGDFSEMKDNKSPFGKTIQEIIFDAVKDFDYPVCFGFPAGHNKKNLALAFGKIWELNVDEKEVNLKIV
ncbi:MAG: LD-carboxypeptidase [Prolixibacteraceae bacterium]|nr:LD-carboxypeptidase [Prolixibacteraceae bacterium]MBT6765584.1 LD-carboxypeptidase [Prolixibacteraceae bacterium]MBT6998940.1 LD-carboxypeptidase [Prolixibacteraceae bacterium]MBT7393889.1 LD-carboxypeptidase [Prolixibacteraceae bacterium]